MLQLGVGFFWHVLYLEELFMFFPRWWKISMNFEFVAELLYYMAQQFLDTNFLDSMAKWNHLQS